MNQWKSAYAAKTKARTLAEALDGADAFFGLSAKGAVTQDMVAAMAPQADHLRHGQSRSGDHARGRACRARRRHRGHRPLRLPEPDQQRAGLPVHLPRRARRAGLDHQRGHEDRRRRGAGRAGPRRGARPGRRRLPRPPPDVRPRVHHSGAVRPAPDRRGADRRRQGGDGFRRRAQAHRRHGRLRRPARGPARSDRRLAAVDVQRGSRSSPSASSSPRARSRP